MVAASFVDRVNETSPTSGTGDLLLDMSTGNLANLTGFRNFKEVYLAGFLNATFHYVIEDGSQFEVGIGQLVLPGIYDDPQEYYLQRDTVLSNHLNTTAFITASTSAKNIAIVETSKQASNSVANTVEVKVMITESLTDLTGLGTYDGVTLVDDDIVCVANPDDLVDMGIWQAHSGAWTRHPYHPLGMQVASYVFKVTNGAAYTDTYWISINTTNVVYGSEDISYFQIAPQSNGLLQATDQATVIFDAWKTHDWEVILSANRTLSIINESKVNLIRVKLTQDATGSRTVTWWSGISWAGGSAPSLTTTANKSDWFGFILTGTGTWDGFIIGQNI